MAFNSTSIVHKFKTVPVDFEKLIDIAEKDAAQEKYNKLVWIADGIETEILVWLCLLINRILYDKQTLELKNEDVENKIPNINDLAKKTDYNTKNPGI